MELEHKAAVSEVEYNKLPQSIKNRVIALDKKLSEVTEETTPADITKLEAQSAAIADLIQDWVERDLPENKNTNMLTGEELARAQKVGLTETATIEEVEALEIAQANKEAEEKAAADKAAADKAAADKAAADKAAADKAAGENADNPPAPPAGGDPDKAAADKAAADKAAADKAAADKAAADKAAADKAAADKAAAEAASNDDSDVLGLIEL